jgi:hypothetical protein
VSRVDLVDRREVVHVRVEDRRLHEIIHGRSCGLEHGSEVEQRLLGLRRNSFSRFTCRRIDACSTGAEHEAAAAIA